MSENEQMVDDSEDIAPLRWTTTLLNTPRLVENMTPLEAYSIGFKDGYHYAKRPETEG